ncbi:MAG: NAD(P)H-dependent oxidoreductase [Deltaproteobacteria bacterium]|nr:NAD(P)H-dependent oxidoreductase [Deltaproteobacteria bacterium]
MRILGLQGSPRKKGNTRFLLDLFLEKAQEHGAHTRVVHVDERHILPCKEYTVCEKKGFCPIDDDMKKEIYALLREAEAVILATPIFFYNTTAQLKALIDRCQTLWARKYKLHLTDPGQKYRKGVLLALGATKGTNLFEGMKLTAKYFFDAIGADFSGSLTYPRIEHPGDMEKHPTVHEDVKTAVQSLVSDFAGRRRILFACRENACRSQMAAAFTQCHAGDKIAVISAGTRPAPAPDPMMIRAMQEKGIDMGFRKTRQLDDGIESLNPEVIVTMGCGEECPFLPGVMRQDWDLPDPVGQSLDVMREIRDKIEKRVISLIKEVSGGIL